LGQGLPLRFFMAWALRRGKGKNFVKFGKGLDIPCGFGCNKEESIGRGSGGSWGLAPSEER
jgi:hypothetical protein